MKELEGDKLKELNRRSLRKRYACLERSLGRRTSRNGNFGGLEKEAIDESDTTTSAYWSRVMKNRKVWWCERVQDRGRVSGESHVSVKERISIEFSEINSCKRRGLLQESVIEEAERMLR